jgi:succinate dehydrogenase / fumarate reductase, flavoprotein subunit
VSNLLGVKGSRTVDWFHRELGKILWDYCGMGRNRSGLEKALSEIPALREEFHADVRVLGENESLNQSLEKAGRVSDFFELAELMCHDALHREESCGGHFREEHQTEEGEALRDDENFSYVAGLGVRRRRPSRHPAQGAAGVRVHVKPSSSQRSYK